ncbi:hypothetical protein ACIQKE_02445 [Streptomyces griseoviridis]
MLREQAGELAEIAVMADDAADWALSNRLDRLSAWAALCASTCRMPAAPAAGSAAA